MKSLGNIGYVYWLEDFTNNLAMLVVRFDSEHSDHNTMKTLEKTMKPKNYRIILARCGMPRIRITTIAGRSQAYDFRKAYVTRNDGLKLNDVRVLQVTR